MSGADLMPAGVEPLHTELRALIAASRQRLAGAVNAELTHLYWLVGQRLSSEVLGGERAAYGTRLIDQLGERLAQEFGRGFETKNLRRMMQFAQTFPDGSIVATLSRQLSWSHIAALLPLKSAQAPVPQTAAAAPAQVFKAPYFLDFLGLRQGHDEANAEGPSEELHETLTWLATEEAV